jgi:hypothetical protein
MTMMSQILIESDTHFGNNSQRSAAAAEPHRLQRRRIAI